MNPTTDMLDRVATSLLASGLDVGVYKMELSKADFNPNTGEGFTAADFGGYAAISQNVTPTDGVNAVTRNRHVVIPAPAGGFRFAANGAFSGTQTCFGYRIVDVNGGNVVLGYRRFDTPVIFASTADVFTLPEMVTFQINREGLS